MESEATVYNNAPVVTIKIILQYLKQVVPCFTNIEMLRVPQPMRHLPVCSNGRSTRSRGVSNGAYFSINLLNKILPGQAESKPT